MSDEILYQIKIQNYLINQVHQQVKEQEDRLNQIFEVVQAQRQQPIEQQEETLNNILNELTRIQQQSPPQPLPLRSSFSLIDKLDLDMEKLTKIVLFLSSLYNNNNESETK